MIKATFRSIPEMLLQRIASTPDAMAFQYPKGAGWESMTWRQVGERVRNVACGLAALGLQPEQRCAILASTRVEWILADLGILCAGGATTTLYPASTAEECAFILGDAQVTFLFAENDEQVAKVAPARAGLPSLKKVINLEAAASAGGDEVIGLARLEELGRTHHGQNPAAFEQTARAVKPDHLATLIYTSGTTGRPKGVELTHECWVYEAEAIDALGLLTPRDVQYLWLPLAHSFGKVLEAAQLRIGFPTAVDGRVERMVDNLSVIRPTFVAAVPRIFEKVHNKVVTGAQQAGGAKWKLFQWALGIGREVSALRRKGEPVGIALTAQHALAEKLVHSKLQNRFGGRLRFFISGSAPLSLAIAEFFHAFGVLILEGYGLTESSAASFVNRPDRFRFGTVGPPLPGTEVKIAPSDGEILIKSRGLMRGYHGLPDETAATLKDGWLHTGDIGEVVDGFLRITDRKKDLIKTSGGKYVAPAAVEGRLKATCPYVSQVLVHGNTRNFCSALIAIDEESIRAWAAGSGVPVKPYAEMAREPAVRKLIQEHVDRLNAQLPPHEQIRKFTLLPRDLTVEGGELTASMKPKRKLIEEQYRAELDAMY